MRKKHVNSGLLFPILLAFLLCGSATGQDAEVTLVDSCTVSVTFDLLPADGLVVWYKRADQPQDLAEVFRAFAVITSHASYGIRIKNRWTVQRRLPPGCYLFRVARHKDGIPPPEGFGRGALICLDYKVDKEGV